MSIQPLCSTFEQGSNVEHRFFHMSSKIQEKHSVRDTKMEPQTVRKNSETLLNHAKSCRDQSHFQSQSRLSGRRGPTNKNITHWPSSLPLACLYIQEYFKTSKHVRKTWAFKVQSKKYRQLTEFESLTQDVQCTGVCHMYIYIHAYIRYV